MGKAMPADGHTMLGTCWSSIFLSPSTKGPVALMTHLQLVSISSPVSSSRNLAPQILKKTKHAK